MSLRIAIVGYGKMGQMVARLAPQHGCEVVRIVRSEENLDGQALTREALNGVDVAIEFTTPGAAIVNVKSMMQAEIPVVTGTTGWFKELAEIQETAAARYSRRS